MQYSPPALFRTHTEFYDPIGTVFIIPNALEERDVSIQSNSHNAAFQYGRVPGYNRRFWTWIDLRGERGLGRLVLTQLFISNTETFRSVPEVHYLFQFCWMVLP